MDETRADEFIKGAPPGSCIYTLVQTQDGLEETAFLIREQSGIIADLGRAPAVHIRAGLVTQSNVLLLPVCLRVSGELYEMWINYHAEGTRPALEALAIQEQLGLHFFDDAGQVARSLVVPNQIQAFWRDAIRRCARLPPWSMRAFDAAKASLYAAYPRPQALWQALGGPGEHDRHA